MTSNTTYLTSFTNLSITPLVPKPNFAIKAAPKKETQLEIRRRENIARLRRKYKKRVAKKALKTRQLWTNLEFLAVVLMTSALSVMALKTAFDYQFIR